MILFTVKFLPFKRMLLILFMLLGTSALVLAQQSTLEKINFSARNETLASVLGRISANKPVNLTYDASDPALEKQVTYSANQKDVITILSEILTQTGREFKNVGNHIVIVRSPINTPANSVLPQKSNAQSNKSSPAVLPEILTDTIIIRDTLIRFDTIIRIQKEYIYDTIFIKEQPEVDKKSGRRKLSLPRNIFRFEPDRQDGWALNFHFAQMGASLLPESGLNLSPELEKVKKSESFSLRNFGLGAAIQYNKGRLSFLTGLSLNIYNNRFNYSELFETGGFYKKDTLDIFYTIIQSDTNFFYVTDSTYLPLDSREIVYDRNNRISLLEWRGAMHFTLYTLNDFNFYLKGGFSAGMPLWLNGNSIGIGEGYPVLELEKENFSKWLFAWQAGFGVRYQLANFVSVYAEPFYKQYWNEPTPSHPLSRRLQGGGLNIGMIYYF
jgi:opacity protein-like surface antigen